MATKKATAQAAATGRDFQAEVASKIAAFKAATTAGDKIDANDSLSDLLQEWIDDIEEQNKTLQVEENAEHLSAGDAWAKTLGYDSMAQYVERMGLSGGMKAPTAKPAATGTKPRAPLIPKYSFQKPDGTLDHYFTGRHDLKPWLPLKDDGSGKQVLDEAAAKKFLSTDEHKAPFLKKRAEHEAIHGKSKSGK